MMGERFLVDVVRHRRLARIALRLCVAVLVFVALRWAAHWAGWALSADSRVSFPEENGWTSYGITIGFYIGTAALLFLGEPTIVRWVVPYESGGCLGCGYAAAGAAVCPECGLPVPGRAGVEAGADEDGGS